VVVSLWFTTGGKPRNRICRFRDDPEEKDGIVIVDPESLPWVHGPNSGFLFDWQENRTYLFTLLVCQNHEKKTNFSDSP